MAATLDGTTEAVRTPIDLYLAEQADMSSVERFARRQVMGRTRQWTDLIPLTSPDEGQQFRFDVDLDLCTGCKACVTACHSLNGLDESESFRSVGLLIGSDVLPETGTTEPVLDLNTLTTTPSAHSGLAVNQPSAHSDLAVNQPSAHSGLAVNQPSAHSDLAVNQIVTTACHHCVDPGCLNGCPAEAYEKDPVTGIVSHLDDACIGCNYCTMTCPYDVPVYNKRLGIVRKCDMCAGRLAEGEAPACVQGCPNQAISISIVDTAELVEQAKPASTIPETKRLVPGAADSALTTPTTAYRRQQPLPDGAGPIDQNTVEPGHGHTPLALLLVLSQLAVGLHLASLFGVVVGLFGNQSVISALLVPSVAAGAIAISVLHLGQPLKAWRAVLGFRHSWLSREVVALAVFFGLTLVSAAAVIQDWPVSTVSGVATGVAGVVVVGSSAMVYGATGRRWWRPTLVISKFGLTTVITGLAAMLAVLHPAEAELRSSTGIGVIALLILLTLFKLTLERSVFSSDDVEQRRTAALLLGKLAAQEKWRVVLGLVGGVLCPVVAVASGSNGLAVFVLVAGAECLIAGEILERVLFFRASSVPTMPGSAT